MIVSVVWNRVIWYRVLDKLYTIPWKYVWNTDIYSKAQLLNLKCLCFESVVNQVWLFRWWVLCYASVGNSCVYQVYLTFPSSEYDSQYTNVGSKTKHQSSPRNCIICVPHTGQNKTVPYSPAQWVVLFSLPWLSSFAVYWQVVNVFNSVLSVRMWWWSIY